jgi:hypothetical protein
MLGLEEDDRGDWIGMNGRFGFKSLRDNLLASLTSRIRELVHLVVQQAERSESDFGEPIRDERKRYCQAEDHVGRKPRENLTNLKRHPLTTAASQQREEMPPTCCMRNGNGTKRQNTSRTHHVPRQRAHPPRTESRERDPENPVCRERLKDLNRNLAKGSSAFSPSPSWKAGLNQQDGEYGEQ